MWWMWHGDVGHWVINRSPGSHGNDITTSLFDDVFCPNEVGGWEDTEGAKNVLRCLGDTTTSTTSTTSTTTTSTTLATTTSTTYSSTSTTTPEPITEAVCGNRLTISALEAENADLEGLWTLAMDGNGNVLLNHAVPYYQQRGGVNFIWWMWHGNTGHWVVNETPGTHGDDRLTSVLGAFGCPQDIFEWQASHKSLL